MLSGLEVYCNGYCISGTVGCVLQYKYCIVGSWLGRQCHDTKFVSRLRCLVWLELGCNTKYCIVASQLGKLGAAGARAGALGAQGAQALGWGAWAQALGRGTRARSAATRRLRLFTAGGLGHDTAWPAHDTARRARA